VIKLFQSTFHQAGFANLSTARDSSIAGESTPNPETTFVVALTGGIASGKTTVSNLFSELGVPIVDTDLIARELVEPGQPLLASIVSAFGHELLDAYGRLKRRKLRAIIFSNSEGREQLDAIMHPQIAAEARDRINQVTSGYCILVIPLLAEKGRYSGVDRILVVDTNIEAQRARLSSRDDVSDEQADAAIAAQASREQRLAIADDVIENSGSKADLKIKVEELHIAYLSYSN
jgi:dephospho-CoA kinase